MMRAKGILPVRLILPALAVLLTAAACGREETPTSSETAAAPVSETVAAPVPTATQPPDTGSQDAGTEAPHPAFTPESQPETPEPTSEEPEPAGPEATEAPGPRANPRGYGSLHDDGGAETRSLLRRIWERPWGYIRGRPDATDRTTTPRRSHVPVPGGVVQSNGRCCPHWLSGASGSKPHVHIYQRLLQRPYREGQPDQPHRIGFIG